MTLADKLGWYARMAGMAFLLLATAFLSAITAMRFAIQGRSVTVPNVVSLSADQAQTALASRGLGMKVADRIFSELPVDQVVRQSPPGGATVKTGQRAHVVLSLGPQRVSIPALEGMTLRTARIELLRAGLQLGEVTQVHLPSHPADHILRQNPPPRATNVGGPRVSLLVSLGPEPPSFVMPDLTGLDALELPARLAPLGLRLGKLVAVPSGGLPRGTVVGTTPARGARAWSGTAVDIQVVGDVGG
ncbi:MAG: PASTA domain-containing protein [Candidatus Acidiferrales bacterium]